MYCHVSSCLLLVFFAYLGNHAGHAFRCIFKVTLPVILQTLLGDSRAGSYSNWCCTKALCTYMGSLLIPGLFHLGCGIQCYHSKPPPPPSFPLAVWVATKTSTGMTITERAEVLRCQRVDELYRHGCCLSSPNLFARLFCAASINKPHFRLDGTMGVLCINLQGSALTS